MSDTNAAVDPTASQPKVLVVEDDPDIRNILALFLAEKGFQVKVAENGASRPRAPGRRADRPHPLRRAHAGDDGPRAAPCASRSAIPRSSSS